MRPCRRLAWIHPPPRAAFVLAPLVDPVGTPRPQPCWPEGRTRACRRRLDSRLARRAQLGPEAFAVILAQSARAGALSTAKVDEVGPGVMGNVGASPGRLRTSLIG